MSARPETSGRPPAHIQLTEGPVGTALARMTLPMVVGFLSMMGFNLADTYFASLLGTEELAAMAFTFPVVGLIMGMTIGLSVGVTAVVSRCMGAGNTDQVRRITRDALLFALGLVVLVCALGISTIDQTFGVMGAGPQLMPHIRAYMQVWYVGMVFLVVPMVGNGAIRAGGDTKTPAKIMMVAAGVNVVLDPLLMFGWGPVPGLGLAGGAWASNLSRLGALATSLTILRRRDLVSLSAPIAQELLKNWRSILSVGVPAATTNLLTPLAQGALTGLMASFGATTVAAFGAGGRVNAFAMMIPMALAASLSPFLGQNFGAKRLDRIHAALDKALRFALLYGLGAWALLALGAPWIAAVFASEPEVAETLVLFLRIVPIALAAEAVFQAIGSTFTTLGKPFRTTFLTAVRLLVLNVPGAYLGAHLAGEAGAFVGLVAGNVLGALIAVAWLAQFRSGELAPPGLAQAAIAAAGE